MSWDFLRLQRDSKPVNPTSNPSGGSQQSKAGDADPNAAEVHLLKNFDARALGAARETVRAKLDEFENSLQALTQLPDHFRQVMAPIENAVNSMALLRNRLEVTEETLNSEQQKAGSLGLELTRTMAELERVQFQLKAEESAHTSLRERSGAMEASLNDLRREHADVVARLNRIEPLLRETAAARDAAEFELSTLRADKSQADDELLLLRQELVNLRQDLASQQNTHNELTLTNQRNQARLEAMQATVGQLEGTLASVNDKLSNVVAALQKERNTSRQLRADNEQLLKEREETKLQFDTQLEASRSRYQFIETMLEESRARFHEETRQLSTARRERAQRDREIGQFTLQIETLQREMAELRGQANSSGEALASTSSLLATEVESRRKLELELDVLRAENSNLLLKQKSLTETVRANLATISEATAKFQNKLAAMRAENDQLRAENNMLRSRQPKELDEDLADLLLPPGEENIVPIR
jgi:chromosome segregation ATPase